MPPDALAIEDDPAVELPTKTTWPVAALLIDAVPALAVL
jgi:hypothetical protein